MTASGMTRAIVGLAALAASSVLLAQDTQPSPVQTSLETAAIHLRDGRLEPAAAELDRVAEAEPDNPWLWYYRGIWHYKNGSPHEAGRCYARAAEILGELGNPDPPLAEKIRSARAKARRQVFNLSVQTGLAYDTNVTYGGAGGEDLGLTSGRGDGKFVSGFQLNYNPIAEPDQVLGFGARLNHTWDFKVEEFNYQDYGGYARYTRRLGNDWKAELRYDYDVTLLNNQQFLSNHALTPTLTYEWKPGTGPIRPTETSVSYQFEWQDYLYESDPAFERNGAVNSVGAAQVFRIQPLADVPWSCDLTLGYRFGYYNTMGWEYDRSQHLFSLDLAMPIMRPSSPREYLIIPDKALTFHFNASWEIGDYRNASLIDQYHRERRDLYTTYAWMLSQKLLDDPDYGELTLHGLIYWFDADSNTRTKQGSPFTYDKFVYGLQLEWTW